MTPIKSQAKTQTETSDASYRTLGKRANGIVIEKKSVFTGVGGRVASAPDAAAFLADTRNAYPQARHVAYAYIVGLDGNTFRMSDGGEPSGTAGKPILEMLRLHRLVNCAVAVARDFGGILLGAGGLARAYGAACKAAIDACGIIIMEKTARAEVDVPYPLWDIVRYKLSGERCEIVEVEYMESVKVRLRVRESDAGHVFALLKETGGGMLTPVVISTEYEGW